MERKYIYEGMSIKDYCAEHNITSQAIYNRISYLKKENPSLTDEELVREAFQKCYTRKNLKYFYINSPLHNYCKLHPELNYHVIYSYILYNLRKNPNINVKDLIINYINGSNHHRQWSYLDIPLKIFCDKNAISYNSIRNYLYKALKKSKYASWNEEEIISYLIERRYKINGKSLQKYCESINFPYDTMHEILKDEVEKNPNIKFKTILSSTITTINQYRLINYQMIKQFPKYLTKYLNNKTIEYLKKKDNVNTLTLTR